MLVIFWKNLNKEFVSQKIMSSYLQESSVEIKIKCVKRNCSCVEQCKDKMENIKFYLFIEKSLKLN